MMTNMNRAEARALRETLRETLGSDRGQDATLRPWTKIPATCAQCQTPPARLITFDGQFLCEDHADTRLDELCDQHGMVGSYMLEAGVPSWGSWLRGNLYWRPRNWLTYKGGPFRPFMIRRAWTRILRGESADL